MKEEKLLTLLKALLKNSKRSDRELAKSVKASQPTVTRNRKILSSYIRSYTIVPEFAKIGYEILAFTFARAKTYDRKMIDSKTSLVENWINSHPNVLFSSDGEGLGKDVVIVSLHRDYSKYSEFIRDYILNFADVIIDVQSFIVSLKSGTIFKPFDLTYLADDTMGLL